jgi:hypothetical protein
MNLKAFWDKHKMAIVLIAVFILYGIAGTNDFNNLTGVQK